MANRSKAQTVSAQISGRNFQGILQVKGESISMDLKQFKRKSFYTFEASNLILEKDPKKFLIFKKAEILFNELVSNLNLQISDENTLVVPFHIIYKGKIFQLKIQIPLKQRKFSHESQKLQSLFEQIQRLNQQRKLLTPESIHFKGDQKDLNFKSFEISNDQTNIKKIANNSQKTIFNHYEPLKSKGVFYFKVQILSINWNNSIYLGICGSKAKSQTYVEKSSYFMGLNYNSGNLYAKGVEKNVTFNNNSSFNNNSNGVVGEKGQGFLKVEIDMNRKWISWFQGNNLLFTTEIGNDLRSVNIYPMICMSAVGDTVEILN